MAEDVKLAIKATADTSGLKQTEEGLKRVKAAAKDTGNASESAAAKMRGGFSKLGGWIEKTTSAVGKLGAVFNAFGIITVITTLISLFQSLRDWVNKDKVAAEEMARAIQDERNEDAIERSTDNYKQLNDEIQRANRAQQLRLQLLAQEKAEKEGTEDAKLNLAEVNELAGIAFDDPDAAQRQTLVRNKYAKTRAERAAQRAIDNRIARQGELYASADQKEEDAEKILKNLYNDNTAFDLKRQVEQLKRDETNARRKGEDEDDIKKITERRKKMEDQLDGVIEANKKKKADAESLKESAAADRAKAQSLFGSENAAIDKSTSDATNQMAANRRKRADEAAKKEAEETRKAAKKARNEAEWAETIENGGFAADEYRGRIRATEAEMQAAQDAHDRERLDVFRAQNALDTFNAENAGRGGAGVRRQRAALVADLARETEEVQASEVELKKTMAALTSTLQSLKKELAEVQSNVKQAVSRQNAAADAAPAGE